VPDLRLRAGGDTGVVFVRVNQVLVRFWACRGGVSDRVVCFCLGTGCPAAMVLRSEACVVVC
jgi:hypothetical protein